MSSVTPCPIHSPSVFLSLGSAAGALGSRRIEVASQDLSGDSGTVTPPTTHLSLPAGAGEIWEPRLSRMWETGSNLTTSQGLSKDLPGNTTSLRLWFQEIGDLLLMPGGCGNENPGGSGVVGTHSWPQGWEQAQAVAGNSCCKSPTLGPSAFSPWSAFLWK